MALGISQRDGEKLAWTEDRTLLISDPPARTQGPTGNNMENSKRGTEKDQTRCGMRSEAELSSKNHT